MAYYQFSQSFGSSSSSVIAITFHVCFAVKYLFAHTKCNALNYICSMCEKRTVDRMNEKEREKTGMNSLIQHFQFVVAYRINNKCIQRVGFIQMRIAKCK